MPTIETLDVTKIESTPTVGEIAASDIRKAEVFRKMGVDFCCGGKKTLKEACVEAGVSEDQLNAALEAVSGKDSSQPQHDFNKWDPAFLADYIINIHHRYVRESAPIIEQLAVKVANHHGANHPELIPLANGLNRFLADLLLHMKKEEQFLFPAIRHKAASSDFPIIDAIGLMEMEHAASGEDVRQFRQLTRDYTLPADACNSYTYLFHKLQEFEADLFQHIHLENNILFPKALYS
ncbi:iron-sulfur cluster repair di-iron protein [Puia dinghuensis]|uniref:Iron-sulfur cluster repair di-iron protein n=1 Tax=Puia dinghuensis TaxID=1792502 RepID=A0A8J2UDS4_9BACT|nr:iron-sulfur cluster repair di-iron protein [Puia dinghuensis]GGB03376.1 iron-sulfur cluster repair di-iron protein [Puia dinghuensis]